MLHFSRAATTNEILTAVVTEVAGGRDELLLTFDRPLDALAPGDWAENPGRSPDVFLFEDNTVLDCPHMRVSPSKKTVLRRNRLRLESRDVYVCDLFKFWYESGAVEEMLVEDNDFAARGRPCIEVTTTRAADTTRLHGRIVIRRNRFAAASEAEAISVAHAREASVGNNEFGVEM